MPIERIEHIHAGDIVWLRSRARWRRALVVRTLKKKVQLACKTKDGGVYVTRVDLREQPLFVFYDEVQAHLASDAGKYDRDTPFSDCVAPTLAEVP